jgi:hypothetical protein
MFSTSGTSAEGWMQSSSSPRSRGQTKKGLFCLHSSQPLRLGGTAPLEIIFYNSDGMSLMKLQQPGLPLTAPDH